MGPGDLGIADEEGNVHLVGRGKGVIIRGGSNVYTREIEDRLRAFLDDFAKTGTKKVRWVELARLPEEARRGPSI